MRLRASLASVGVAATVLVACSTEPQPSFDLVAVPTQSPGSLFEAFGPAGCPAALLEGTIVRHEEAGLAVDNDPNFPPAVVAWPHGWVARDLDGVRELLDGGGNVVAREGDHISAGGGFYPPNDRFHPCGEITFIAAP